MTIVVLSHNTAHFRHYAQQYWMRRDVDVRLINPQRDEQLMGLRPDLIIALPEWVHGKSEAFVDKVETMLKKMRKENV